MTTRNDILSRIGNMKSIPKFVGEWIQNFPDPQIVPIEHRVGDVFMHPIFKHPYVLLKRKGSSYICTLLSTSNNHEYLYMTKSRFFNGNYISKSLFVEKELRGRFMGIYDNPKHLRQVYKDLARILGVG